MKNDTLVEAERCIFFKFWIICVIDSCPWLKNKIGDTWWIAHIFQILNNMYNQGMSLALTWMVVICGVCLGHRHYILYVWDRNCEMRFFFGWGRYILYECVVKWLWLGTICWITRHPFIFYNKFTQLFNVFFLTILRCAQDRFKNYNPIQILVPFHKIWRICSCKFTMVD